MDESRGFSRFLAWMTGSVALGCLLAAACVVVVDPYRLYQLVRIPGFSDLRPAPEHNQEEIKLTLARKAGANVYVMGNSRAEWGFDPAALARAPGAVPYNLAISGSGIATSRSEFAYLHSRGATPRRIVMGVEFLDFPVDGAAAAPAAAVGKPAGYPIERFKWRFDSLFSLTALSDSVTTLRVQRGLEAPLVTANGFNPMLEYAKYARDEGYYAIFRQRAEDYAASFVRKPRQLAYADSGSSPAREDLRAMIALAGKERVALQLVIYPYHAQMLALFEQAGLWPLFESWKRMLAEEVAQAQRDYPGVAIELWDFSGFAPYQCEPIPAKGDRRTGTRWYWEAGHFKKALGDLILARLQDDAGSTAPAFGERLTPASLEDNRQRIARERAVCAAAAPSVFTDASLLVARAARPRS
ncbi:hypothetical protein [Herbaspirillum robiniae]|nr:hypothetical protein [Herbaspirillum robiniae]